MKGVIYLIKTADGLYVGSTIDFKTRCRSHKSRIKPDRQELLYKNIISNNGIYKIEIYCNVNCRDRRHLEFFEEQYRIILGANLNQVSAYGLDIENRKKYTKIYNANYRKTHTRIYAPYLKEKVSCACGGKYTHQNKPRHFKSNIHLKYIKDSQAPPL